MEITEVEGLQKCSTVDHSVPPFAWITLKIKHRAMLGVSIHAVFALFCFCSV